MTAGINPEVLRLSHAHGVSIGAAHRMWLADSSRKPSAGPDFDFDCDVHCGCCGVMHHIDDDCPVPPRHYYDKGMVP